MPSNHHLKRPHQPLSPSSSSTSYFYIFVSIISLTALFLLSSHYITSNSPPLIRIESVKPIKQYVPLTDDDNGAAGSAACDYSEGKWFYDPTVRAPRYDQTCKEIYKGWNCVAGNRSGAMEIVKWRWQPNHCALPQFDPIRFLESHRDISIGSYYGPLSAGFVGDSLNRNMFVSLFCSLRRVAGEIKKWRPAGADRGFTFLKYNFTIAYHRTNLLARYGRWSANAKGGVLESLGYKEGYRVDIDVPEGTWAEAPSFHNILIYNTGHWWWAPSKFDPVKSPMLFHEKGQPLVPPLSPETGLDVVLRRMKKSQDQEHFYFFALNLLGHFEGGDWDQGGSCARLRPLSPKEVEQFFSVEKNGTNVEVRLVNEHLNEAIKGSAFRLLDVTRMSEFRAMLILLQLAERSMLIACTGAYLELPILGMTCSLHS
ncbi:hypothetical protein OSB04_016107 [Centaurea solstitialis]|uniref:Trichome birefringence-like N-terminal domain-containing protein n=1 Tax=Centaurea solstitialis TaxID=347529 RepID=A0AA38W9I2_9ASTR|nr:hypothetical protein OSB04_016107 [Centaurea solstitialis]